MTDQNPRDSADAEMVRPADGAGLPVAGTPGLVPYPGKLVDMVESQEFQAALAVGRSARCPGGILWHWAEKKTVECFGPYIFPPGSNPEMARP